MRTIIIVLPLVFFQNWNIKTAEVFPTQKKDKPTEKTTGPLVYFLIYLKFMKDLCIISD